MSKQETKTTGISTFGLLGVVLVTLKLCGVIDWSWLWVTAPFWGGLAIVLCLMVVALLAALVVKAIE